MHFASALCVCCVVFAGCRRPTPPPQRPNLKTEALRISGLAKGLAVSRRDAQGRLLYELRTRESKQQGATENATLTNTRVTLYHEGAPDMIVDAPNARVDANSKDLVMWGGLHATAISKGAQFRVNRMTWNADTKAFVGIGSVHYERSPISMEADRITGKTPLTTVNLDRNVRLKIID